MVTRSGASVRVSRCGRRIGTSWCGYPSCQQGRDLTSGNATGGHPVDTLSWTVQFGQNDRQERAQMSEPTNDGKQHPDPDPEKDQDHVQDDVQDQTPDSVFSDPTAPIWADPTAAIPPAPTPPGAAHPHSDQPADHPQVGPSPAPPVSNPYAQGPPPPPYAQGPPPPAYGQAQSGQQYPAYSQQPYASGQQAPANASAIVLTVLSGVSIVSCNILAIASLVLGIVALTKNTTDHGGSRRLTKIGWIVFAAVWGVAILVFVGVLVFAALSSNSSSTDMFGN